MSQCPSPTKALLHPAAHSPNARPSVTSPPSPPPCPKAPRWPPWLLLARRSWPARAKAGPVAVTRTRARTAATKRQPWRPGLGRRRRHRQCDLRSFSLPQFRIGLSTSRVLCPQLPPAKKKKKNRSRKYYFSKISAKKRTRTARDEGGGTSDGKGKEGRGAPRGRSGPKASSVVEEHRWIGTSPASSERRGDESWSRRPRVCKARRLTPWPLTDCETTAFW